MSNTEITTKVVVLGAGPSGYSAAFRCADLGFNTVLVERYSTLGGVCLNVGCIPSKALLHVANIIYDAKSFGKHGIVFGEPHINLDKLRSWKNNVVNQLSSGLRRMSKLRKVTVLNGYGTFTSANTMQVVGERASTTITFNNAIIAVGSRPIQLPFLPADHRIWDSTDALALTSVPNRLLVIGGGIIGLEIATVYHALGSEIDVVEINNQVMPAVDTDLVNILSKHISTKYNIRLETAITTVTAQKDGIYVSMEGKLQQTQTTQRYDAVLVAIGRVPNGKLLNAGQAGVYIDEQGFIPVDQQMRTNVPHIYAIGDIVGQPMLAHKGIHQGHVAAEVIAGKKHTFSPQVIPSIAYTVPEVAWVGLTEKEAQDKGINYEVARFPWSASGRAIASDCQEGMTKLMFDQKTHRIIGGAVIGINGSELLGEICLAIEMGCEAQDLALTIHAHPTLHESIGLAAEIYEGTITDLPNIKA